MHFDFVSSRLPRPFVEVQQQYAPGYNFSSLHLSPKQGLAPPSVAARSFCNFCCSAPEAFWFTMRVLWSNETSSLTTCGAHSAPTADAKEACGAMKARTNFK